MNTECTGLGEQTARSLVIQVEEEGLITDESHRSPYYSLPARYVDRSRGYGRTPIGSSSTAKSSSWSNATSGGRRFSDPEDFLP